MGVEVEIKVAITLNASKMIWVKLEKCSDKRSWKIKTSSEIWKYI